MKDNRRVDILANKLASVKNRGLVAIFFKKIVLNKFKSLQNGFIEINEGNERYVFGDSKSPMKSKVDILSSEFYVFLGSGGLLGVSEAYAAGLWKANDLVSLIRIVFKNKDVMNQLESGWSQLIKPINSFIHWQRKNSLSGSKKNILAHYDLSNEFYQLWLDETMTYSCAIFKDNYISLKDASIEKLDRICRKLKLKAEDSVLEIGSGWGSFCIHAAKKYGCHITTTTISDAQYEYAKKKIQATGLDGKITLLKEDYRNLKGKFDKIVSIEMIEAVGHQYVPHYFNKISSLLNDNGFFAMQGITYNDPNFDVYKHSVDFIKKYIFPGSCLISLSQIKNVVKKNTNLSIIHLEDISKHYATTLKTWRNNFLQQIESVRKLGFSSEFINIWEFYFVYCEAGFIENNIGDYQFIFSKPDSKNIDITF